MSTLWSIVILLALLCGSAFFSAAEMSISSANRMRMDSMAEEGDRRAVNAVRVLEHYDDTLSAILIGNNLCNIGSDALVTAAAMALLGARYTGIVSVIITVVMACIIVIFCESVPKISAKKNANRLALTIGGLLRLLTVVLKPATWVVTLLIRLLTLPFKGEKKEGSEEEAAAELQSIIETVEDEGVIDEDRSEMMRSAMEFSQIPVMDVMTARVDMQAIDVEDDWQEELLNRDDPFTRIPVYEDSIDNIIGILQLNRFFRQLLTDPGAQVRDYLMKPLYMYKTLKLSDALSQFRREQQHLAIVTDEYGGTLGVVTLEDVLEQLVGEIWDENDEVEDEVIERPDGAFEVDGDLPVSDFAELLGVTEEELDTESTTAGGWTIEKRGTFPRAGDEIIDGGLRVKVLAMDEDGLRVERILAEKLR